MKRESIDLDLYNINGDISEFNHNLKLLVADRIEWVSGLSTIIQNQENRIEAYNDKVYTIDNNFINLIETGVDYALLLRDLVVEYNNSVEDDNIKLPEDFVSDYEGTQHVNHTSSEYSLDNLSVNTISSHSSLVISESTSNEVKLSNQILVGRLNKTDTNYLTGLTLSGLIENVTITENGKEINLSEVLNTLSDQDPGYNPPSGITTLEQLIDTILP